MYPRVRVCVLHIDGSTRDTSLYAQCIMMVYDGIGVYSSRLLIEVYVWTNSNAGNSVLRVFVLSISKSINPSMNQS